MTNGDRDPDQEREEKGREMTDRLASRFDDTGSTSEPQGDGDDLDSDSAKTSASNESKPSKTEQTSVKDRPSVLMYLPEDLHDDLDIRFDELNARYKREYGEALEKNRDYYPAVIEAGLEGKDLEEVLDL